MEQRLFEALAICQCVEDSITGYAQTALAIAIERLSDLQKDMESLANAQNAESAHGAKAS